jgi:hypothetical protein
LIGQPFAWQQRIDEYAKATRGPVLNTGARDAPEHLARLLDEIRARYTLGYKPAQVEPPGKFCKLSPQLPASTLNYASRASW